MACLNARFSLMFSPLRAPYERSRHSQPISHRVVSTPGCEASAPRERRVSSGDEVARSADHDDIRDREAGVAVHQQWKHWRRCDFGSHIHAQCHLLLGYIAAQRRFQGSQPGAFISKHHAEARCPEDGLPWHPRLILEPAAVTPHMGAIIVTATVTFCWQPAVDQVCQRLATTCHIDLCVDRFTILGALFTVATLDAARDQWCPILLIYLFIKSPSF